MERAESVRRPRSRYRPDSHEVHRLQKRDDFRSFLDGVLADQPEDREIRVIFYNYSTHTRNDDWLAKFEERVRLHFTPTSVSWLNQIEIVFSLLQRKTLNSASFTKPLRLSSGDTTSTPNRSAAESAKSRAVGFETQLLIYAIKRWLARGPVERVIAESNGAIKPGS
jgi:hypothetical protein